MEQQRQSKKDILIIGAGASGLMAARELAKAGKSVVILEARERIGGRIYPLSQETFGYPAQGGAEFVHDDAPVTRSLMSEAHLTYYQTEGEDWDVRSDEPVITDTALLDPALTRHREEIQEKLQELKEDIPISVFLKRYFSADAYQDLRETIVQMVEGYDAGDIERMSTFSLRDEWLGQGVWKHGRVVEGYGALLDFLLSECEKNGVEIKRNRMVEAIVLTDEGVEAHCSNEETYEGEKVVITAPLPTIERIRFSPAIPEKMAAISQMGFGSIIKVLLKFKDAWWLTAFGKDLSRMRFIDGNGHISIWWVQYPAVQSTLTGWINASNAKKLKDKTSEEILTISLASLAVTFKTTEQKLRAQLVGSQVINWAADPLALGAYSFTTPETWQAKKELLTSVRNTIFFSGEALCKGNENATVEGALASGREAAQRILGQLY